MPAGSRSSPLPTGAVALVALAAIVFGGCARARDDAPVLTGGPASTTTAAAGAATATCPAGRKQAPGQTAGKLAFGGVDRTYLQYVPAGYTATTRVPLVFNFHGFGSNAEQQMVYGDFRPIADREGFIIVAPDGQGAVRHFNVLEATATDADDVAFTVALLAELESKLCIDPKRVYSTGMSNGGAMSSALACRAADRFAAIGPVAVLLYLPHCDTAPRAVPVAGFMGTADAVVPFDGGRVNCCGNPVLPGALESMTRFAARAGCTASPAEQRLSPMVLLRRWTGCQAGAVVDFYAIEGGGHTWPGSPIGRGSVTTQEIKASETIWTFFKEHPLP